MNSKPSLRYDAEFKAQAFDLIRTGKRATQIA
jgi:hypothetical protein